MQYFQVNLFWMANLVPKRTGLAADIWSDHNGIERNVCHSNPSRIKITVIMENVSDSIDLLFRIRPI